MGIERELVSKWNTPTRQRDCAGSGTAKRSKLRIIVTAASFTPTNSLLELRSSDRETAINQADLKLVVRSIADWPQFRPVWKDIEQQSVASSPFLAVDCVEAWLKSIPNRTKVRLLSFFDGNRPVGAVILMGGTRKVGLLEVDELYLNLSGEAEGELCMEYNTPLSIPGYEDLVANLLVSYVKRQKWDFLRWDGLSPTSEMRGILNEFGESVSTRESLAYFVDLEAVRAKGIPFVEQLGSSSRTSTRRSDRVLQEELGPIEISIARTDGEIEDFFQDLVRLHEERWQSKGLRGAFSVTRFRRLHRSLVHTLGPVGGVDLVRVKAGAETLAVFYNFIHRDTVYHYQSGVWAEKSNKVRIGMSAHAACIEYYARQGLKVYDFMAGDFGYKQSLSNASRPLIWAEAESGTWKTTWIRRAKKFRQLLQSARSSRPMTPTESSA
jgi:CelD/BcsL family acetyltransferase involved in cellulose biosynthesis